MVEEGGMEDKKETFPEVFIVGFGGPTPGCCKHFDPCPGEAYCFVSGIFGHNPARQDRVKEVAEHYKAFGGFSPFNKYTEEQALALQTELKKRGFGMGVRVGYHHWNPYVRDVIQEIKQDNVREILVLVMTPHQSSVSWDLYLRIVGEGIAKAGEGAPEVVGVIEPWWKERGFIKALAGRLRESAKKQGIDLDSEESGLLLSAHAVPEAVARTSPYCRQVEESAAALIQELGGIQKTVLAYQSAPEDGRIQWTGPSIAKALEELHRKGVRKVFASAIGFVCDNVEVLYDLGVEGQEKAEKLGMEFFRAESVHCHEDFIAMLADRVEAQLQKEKSGVLSS